MSLLDFVLFILQLVVLQLQRAATAARREWEEEKCLLGVFITCQSHKYAFYQTSDICGCVDVAVAVASCQSQSRLQRPELGVRQVFLDELDGCSASVTHAQYTHVCARVCVWANLLWVALLNWETSFSSLKLSKRLGKCKTCRRTVGHISSLVLIFQNI